MDLNRIIYDDLYNELRWMLVAATEWYICEEARINSKAIPMPPHLIVLSMDSALLHIRSLYDFFIFTPTKIFRQDTVYAKDFNVKLFPTSLYKNYIDSLNKRLFHIDKFRPAPKAKNGNSINTDVNRQIYNLSKDVLMLLDEFAKQLPQFKPQLDSARKLSIDGATASAIYFGHTEIFS